ALKHIDREHPETELSFWINSNHTGRGYMTEAGLVITAYAFEYLSLNRVCAYHMRRNPASGNVLKRLGFTREGCLRQRVQKWGLFEDVIVWAKLRQDKN
ncbi:MAG: GNAT family N-acetyltransferase, partial [Gammaproteobacteria bacterium]